MKYIIVDSVTGSMVYCNDNKWELCFTEKACNTLDIMLFENKKDAQKFKKNRHVLGKVFTFDFLVERRKKNDAFSY